jgi:RNA polymerase sigma factor (sigma-70 family)
MDDSAMENTAVLIGRWRAGDADARERLVARFLPMLRRWAHGRLPRHARGMAETDDLVQATLLRALERADDFEDRGEGAFLAWLRRILLNVLRDELRRSRRRPAGTALDAALPDPAPALIEQAIGSELMARYESALAALPDRQREAVILRLEFGYGYAELAAAIDAPSADAARMTVSRTLAAIAGALDG